MTTAPRNAANVPVRHSVRSNAQGIGHSLIATERFDEFLNHAPMSQIVRGSASPKNHSLCVDAHFCEAHSDCMDSGDKNGGPNHLRAWREFRGLTQSELAERVGTNANMIGYLETGERGLSAKWLRKLADALDTSPGMILDHDPNELDSDILEIWATASNRVKRQISEIARTLLRDGTNG